MEEMANVMLRIPRRILKQKEKLDFLEIFVRGKNDPKCVEILKAAIANATPDQTSGALGLSFGDGQWIGIALSAINLAATVGGTVILYKKVDQLSVRVDKLAQTAQDIKEAQLEFNLLSPGRDVLNDYKEFLSDSEKGKPLHQDKLADSIKKCCKCLESTINLRSKYPMDISLQLIHMLLPVLSGLMVLYDQHYYNAEGGEHALHADWLSLFDRVCSNAFLEELCDDLLLEKHVHNDQMNEALALHVLTAQRCKAEVCMTLEELRICGSRETFEQMEQIVQQYTAVQAAMIRDELTAQLGEEAAAQLLHAAVQPTQA